VLSAIAILEYVTTGDEFSISRLSPSTGSYAEEELEALGLTPLPIWNSIHRSAMFQSGAGCVSADCLLLMCFADAVR